MNPGDTMPPGHASTVAPAAAADPDTSQPTSAIIPSALISTEPLLKIWFSVRIVPTMIVLCSPTDKTSQSSDVSETGGAGHSTIRIGLGLGLGTNVEFELLSVMAQPANNAISSGNAALYITYAASSDNLEKLK